MYWTTLKRKKDKNKINKELSNKKPLRKLVENVNITCNVGACDSGCESSCCFNRSSSFGVGLNLGLGIGLFGVCKKVENLLLGSFFSCSSSDSSFFIHWSCNSCQSYTAVINLAKNKKRKKQAKNNSLLSMQTKKHCWLLQYFNGNA